MSDAAIKKREFRWNKKRRHYAFIFDDAGPNAELRENLLLHTEPKFAGEDQKEINGRKHLFYKGHRRLKRAPNGSNRKIFVEKRIYKDMFSSFDEKVYDWHLSKEDLGKVRRIIKKKKKKETQNSPNKAVLTSHQKDTIPTRPVKPKKAKGPKRRPATRKAAKARKGKARH